MASKHKVFQPNEILTAEDINDALNPQTADHIPKAMAAGTVQWDTDSNTTEELNVVFPTGRFTTTPVMTTSVTDSTAAPTYGNHVITQIDSTGAKVLVNNGFGGRSRVLYWIAVEM